MQLDIFTRAYIEAALWSSTDYDGDPLDNGWHELAAETLNAMVADCARFQRECDALIQLAINSGRYYGYDQAGHDFWLTRCRHGAGFWDRGLDDIGTQLTDAAHAYGSVELYVGDDGLIYA